MSWWLRQDNFELTTLKLREFTDRVTQNRNKSIWIIVILALGVISSLYIINTAYSTTLNKSSKSFNEFLVVHTQPTVEQLDLTGVSHQEVSEIEGTGSQSTKIEVNNGEVRATVNGTQIPLSQSGTTRATIPNSDGSNTTVTSTSNIVSTSNNTSYTSQINSVNVTTQSNNFSNSFSHTQQTSDVEVQ